MGPAAGSSQHNYTPQNHEEKSARAARRIDASIGTQVTKMTALPGWPTLAENYFDA
jgi:hypothetical protein